MPDPAAAAIPLGTPLGMLLRELIAAEGPLPVSRFMALALGHPAYGYYVTRDPLGRGGDFTTAPEISQMFGELLGLWAAAAWDAAGRPDPVLLVELGPGRGTLMADALRAARLLPAFRAAARVHLVDTSPVLREAQRRALEGSGAPVRWHDRIDDLPPGPALVLANEFLDALPIRQFERREAGWHERLVGLDGDGCLRWGLSPEAVAGMPEAGRPGDVLEIGAEAADAVRAVASRLVQDGGAALFVDYGHVRPGFGDTLQAVRRHAFADPLETPGEADLTAHVDFAAMAAAAAAAGARVHGPVPQGAFLRALGIEVRAARLKRDAAPPVSASVDAALLRLTGEADGRMGALFKVMAVSAPACRALPGFAPTP